MTLFVSVLGHTPSTPLGGVSTWGSWRVLPAGDPTVLACEPGVLSPSTSQVLVLAPTGEADRARIAAATVGAARPDLAVRVESVPVSTALLVRAVELVPDVLTKATMVHASVAANIASLTWGAWLPSVAKLERPAPSLGQHVRSWFARGSGFLAVHGSPGWVARLPTQADPSRRLPRAAGTPTGDLECHAFGELPEPAIATLFSMGLTVRPVRREPVDDPGVEWGSAKAVEIVVNPATPVVLPAPGGLCPACSQPVIGPFCPFCRITPAPSQRLAPEAQGVAR